MMPISFAPLGTERLTTRTLLGLSAAAPCPECATALPRTRVHPLLATRTTRLTTTTVATNNGRTSSKRPKRPRRKANALSRVLLLCSHVPSCLSLMSPTLGL